MQTMTVGHMTGRIWVAVNEFTFFDWGVTWTISVSVNSGSMTASLFTLTIIILQALTLTLFSLFIQSFFTQLLYFCFTTKLLENISMWVVSPYSRSRLDKSSCFSQSLQAFYQHFLSTSYSVTITLAQVEGLTRLILFRCMQRDSNN